MGNVFDSTSANILDESLQPAGLRESSRRSERSGDLRYGAVDRRTPEGTESMTCLFLAPLRGARRCPYVFRWSSLFSDLRLLSRSASSCNDVGRDFFSYAWKN